MTVEFILSEVLKEGSPAATVSCHNRAEALGGK